MLLHVCFRKLYAYCEDTDREDDSRNLQRDGVRNFVVTAAPGPGIEYIRAVGS